MALQETYKQLLAAPNASFFAPSASLHYITTLTTFHGPVDIIKHLNSQAKELKKTKEEFLDVVEGHEALAVEVHTCVEFVSGGGAYLPALDDNFLTDRHVNLPIIHLVSFDVNGKIQQIRLSWDQGSLLKQLDVIGRTGRNWPIHDGKDQIKLISSSVKSAGKAPVEPIQPGDERDLARSRGNSNNAMRDPHASLSLFAPREKNDQDPLPVIVPPRSSAKPPPREYSELFVGTDPENTPVAQSKIDYGASPSKGGAGKNYGPSRLFDHDEGEAEPAPARKPPSEPSKKSNPRKYQHFDFGDGSDPQDVVQPTPVKEGKSRHGSQWQFDDFNTPAAVIPTKTLRNNDVRHWGNSDDEVIDSPIKVKKVDKPRKDAEVHFEFVDDGVSDRARSAGRPRGGQTNNGMGLYKDNLFSEGGASTGDDRPAHYIADVNTRRKYFDSQISMTDDSPAGKATPKQISEDRAKVVKMMDANWRAYDESPNQKENVPASPTSSRPNNGKEPLSEATNQSSNQHKSISIAGDGMGGKKGTETRDAPQKGIATGGDGMGGRKGTGRQWGFGSEDEGGDPPVTEKYKTGRTQGKPQATGGDFWDF